MKLLKIKKNLRWEKIKSYSTYNPYSIAFCYPLCSPPFIIKGGFQQVRLELKNMKTPCFVNQTFWKNKKCGSYWTFYGIFNLELIVKRIYCLTNHKYSRGFKILYKSSNGYILFKKYRKLPKEFPKGIEKLLDIN